MTGMKKLLASFALILLFVVLFSVAAAPVVANTVSGGHNTIGVTAPSTTWYFAEGYTGGQFDEWILLQNSATSRANVTVTFMKRDGSTLVVNTTVDVNSRHTIHVDEYLPDAEVSAQVSSDQPIVAERAMYFNYGGRDGGHSSIGVEAPSTTWYLAEGYTGGSFDTYVLIQNPNPEPAEIAATYMLHNGSFTTGYTVAGNSRYTIHLDYFIPDSEVSTKLESTNGVPVVAERTMYFNIGGRPGGHDSIGVTSASTSWYLAEGFTGGGFDEWILLQNPNPGSADVDILYAVRNGAPQYQQYRVPAESRYSIHVDEIPGLDSAEVSAQVNSSLPIIAERAMYFDYDGRKGGHDSIGAKATSDTWYFAEGYTGGQFDEWLLIQNPSSQSANILITYCVRPGGPIWPTIEYWYSVPPHSRYSIHVNEAPRLGNAEVSAKIESDQPVIAERSMYFSYELPGETEPLYLVTRAIDGDTIKIEGGQRGR
jgi:hypothetical protein